MFNIHTWPSKESSQQDQISQSPANHPPFGLILIQTPHLSTYRTNSLLYDKIWKMAYRKRAYIRKVRVFSLVCPLPCIHIMQIPPSCDQHDTMSDMRKLSSFVDPCSSVLTLYPILYFSCKKPKHSILFHGKVFLQWSCIYTSLPVFILILKIFHHSRKDWEEFIEDFHFIFQASL